MSSLAINETLEAAVQICLNRRQDQSIGSHCDICCESAVTRMVDFVFCGDCFALIARILFRSVQRGERRDLLDAFVRVYNAKAS